MPNSDYNNQKPNQTVQAAKPQTTSQPLEFLSPSSAWQRTLDHLPRRHASTGANLDHLQNVGPRRGTEQNPPPEIDKDTIFRRWISWKIHQKLEKKQLAGQQVEEIGGLAEEGGDTGPLSSWAYQTKVELPKIFFFF